MNIDRLELDIEEVRNCELMRGGEDDDEEDEGLSEKSESLLEDFAFKIYQQKSQESSDKYVCGVERYFSWLELMAEHSSKDYPADPMEADKGDVYDFFSWLSNTDWSINTKKSYFSSVQRFYKWVEQSGKGENITLSHSIDDFTLEPGALEKERQKTEDDGDRFWLPREEVELLWHPNNIPSPRPLYELAFKLMWYTSARSKGICKIKIENIDREEGMIVIPRLKPGDDEPSFRKILYPVERIEPLLIDWLDRGKRDSLGEHVRDSNYLFPSLERPRKENKEIRLRATFLSKKVKQAAKNAGINEVEGKDVRGQDRWKVTAHTIRHSSITYYANETDIPIHMVKRQAGHSKLDTTLSYVHDDDDAFKREFNKAWG